MPPLVIVLLAGVAVLHTFWNVLLKTSDDPLATSARAVTWGLVVATPLAGVAWWLGGRAAPSAGTWAIAAVSAVVELAYFVFLSAAYRRGELSTVYPVARGTAPIVAVAIGVLVLGERLHPVAAAGVALVLVGSWLVRRPTGSGPAFRFALLTGLTIALYSALDRLGVQGAPPWLYAWVLWLFTAALLQGALRVRRASVPGGATPSVSRGGGPARDLALGVAMLGGWFLVLVALSMAPLAVVAPVRESAIVLTAGWGILRLGERDGATVRIAGAAAIAMGVALVALA